LLDAIAAAMSQPPAPASSAEISDVNPPHSESDEYDDCQPGSSD
jgi:hypothetical protein